MMPIRFGADRLVADPRLLGNVRRVALATNDAARMAADARLRTRVALLAAGIPVVLLCAPEHGIEARVADGTAVSDGVDALTGLPVLSLYGERMTPPPESLHDVDAVLFDVPDVGARFYTYTWTLTYLIDACAEARIPLIVLDRPNPLGGALESVEGPLLDLAYASFIGRHTIPIRHGLTLGELARLWRAERRPDADVRVIACEGWLRVQLWPETGLPFVPTSPAIATFEAALCYPGLCLFEATNLSVGRGTELSFQAVGAPWLRAKSNGWTVGAYVQDQWSVRSNFLLTLGLRWDADINTLNNDFESPFADDPVLRNIPMLQNYLVDGDRKNDLNNFAPRMSFSWDVKSNGRTYIRGGAGLMYDRITTFMSFFEKRAAGWRVYNFTNPGTEDPEVLRQRVRSGQGANLLSLNLMKKDMQVPYNIQMSVGLGQQLAPGMALNLDFIHQDAKNLYVQTTPNHRTSSTARKLTNSFGDITLYDDFGEAQFDALVGNLTYTKPGLRLQGSYTLGWYKATFEGLGGYNDETFFVMQPSSGDERHRAVVSGIFDLPFNLKLSGVAIVASPRPFVATDGRDLNGDLNFGNDFLNGKGARTITPDQSWENMYRTFDIRLAKAVSLGGDRKVSVSAEAFNIFNWDNYASWDGRQKNADGSARTQFNNFIAVYAPRQAQVGMRYEF